MSLVIALTGLSALVVLALLVLSLWLGQRQGEAKADQVTAEYPIVPILPADTGRHHLRNVDHAERTQRLEMPR